MAGAASVGAQERAAPAAVSSIAVDQRDSGVVLTGQALALSAGDFDARMRIEKSGPSGRMSTTQGGAFSLTAGESADVATVGLSMAPGDTLVVEVILSAGGEEISRAMLSVGG